jgi:hypothetical protein
MGRWLDWLQPPCYVSSVSRLCDQNDSAILRNPSHCKPPEPPAFSAALRQKAQIGTLKNPKDL